MPRGCVKGSGSIPPRRWKGSGHLDHTGPDVPWRYWHHARGYEMLKVSLAPRKNPTKRIAVPDPTGKPRGGEMALEGPHKRDFIP